MPTSPAKMMKATYVRVSTFEQNISRQLEGKEGALYWDKVSGPIVRSEMCPRMSILNNITYRPILYF